MMAVRRSLLSVFSVNASGIGPRLPRTKKASSSEVERVQVAKAHERIIAVEASLSSRRSRLVAPRGLGVACSRRRGVDCSERSY